MSYLTHLECSGCGKSFEADKIQTFCLECQAPLLVRYDLKAARQHLDREEISKRPKGMWRWSELLPVLNPANRVTLGEGDCPLLSVPRSARKLDLIIYISKKKARIQLDRSKPEDWPLR